MIATPPHILLLESAVDTIADIDFMAAAGVAGVVTRHFRFRTALDEEKPSISVAFTSDSVSEDQTNLTMWEKRRELRLDIIVDASLDDEAGGRDPTGLLKLSRLGSAALSEMQRAGSPVSNLSDFVVRQDIEADHNSHADEGRLVFGAVVLYRVRTDDENILLSQGAL